MTDDPLHDPANMRDPASCKGQARVNCDRLNVRAQPTTEAAVVGQLPKDTTVDVWLLEGAWWWVQAGSIGGWCAARYLRPVETLAASE